MSETGVAALSEADLDADSTLGESGFSQRASRAHRLEPAAVTSNKPGSDDRGSSLGASPWPEPAGAWGELPERPSASRLPAPCAPSTDPAGPKGKVAPGTGVAPAGAPVAPESEGGGTAVPDGSADDGAL